MQISDKQFFNFCGVLKQGSWYVDVGGDLIDL
jgi:hypothetical protein